MKRIYLFIVALVITTSAFAQRSMNFEVTLVKPTASHQVENGVAFDLLAVVKNLGPDSLKQTGDSILWFWTIDGSPLPFQVGNQQGTTWFRFNRALGVGDTVQFNYPGRSLSYNLSQDQTRALCFNAIPRSNKGGNDTIGDPVLNNNAGCVNLLFKKGAPASVAGAVILEGAHNTASMYPNPASVETKLAVNMNTKGEVAVKVLDITGRTVINRSMGYKVKGEYTLPLDISALAPGAYIYQVKMGDDLSTGKLNVTK